MNFGVGRVAVGPHNEEDEVRDREGTGWNWGLLHYY